MLRKGDIQLTYRSLLYLMQSSAKFEALLRGQPTAINKEELLSFESYCADEAILPEQLIKAAMGMYHKGIEAAQHFLQFVAREVICKERYNSPFYKEDKIRLLNYLTIFTLAKATKQSQIQIAQNELLQAKKHLIATEKINDYMPFTTMINRAFIYYYEGEVMKAVKLCHRIEDQVQNYHNQRKLATTTYLLLAQCYFAKKTYEKSLDYYKKCLKKNNCLPVKARLGMAYCYFNLNKFQLAQACFERILKLDNKCYQAMVGLAIVHERNENYQQYFHYLNKANKINSNYPLLVYLIAQNYLVRGQLDKCEEMCNKGLKNVKLFTRIIKSTDNIRNDYQQINTRFINICAQIQHKKGNFDKAIELYQQAAQKQLLWNDISLVQCLIAVKRLKDAHDLLEFTHKNYKKQKKDQKFLKDSYRIMAYLKYRSSENLDSNNSIDFYTEAIKYDKNDIDLKCELAYHLTLVDQHKALRIMQEIEKIYQSCSMELKPEILINIGVLALKNHEPEEAQLKLSKAIQMIQKWNDLDLIQQTGFLIIAKYNYAICMEDLHCFNKAIEIYDEIIKGNKYHIDSYLRKAYVYHKLGNITQCMYTLSTAESVCKIKSLTKSIDKIKLLRVYFLYELEKYEQALTLFKTISQQKREKVYEKVMEYSIKYAKVFNEGINLNYEKIRMVQLQVKQFVDKVYKKDNQPLYFWMMATIIMASLKEITKEQGINTFKNIHTKSTELPSIKYNMGLYYLHQDDNDAANSCFSQCRQTSKCSKADQMIAYICLINKQYKKSIKVTKRNILMDPSNLKYRAQLMFSTQARCEEQIHLKQITKKIVLNDCEELKACHRFHRHVGSLDLSSPIPSISHNRELISQLRMRSQEKIITSKIIWDEFDRIRREKYDQQGPKSRGKMDNSYDNESEDEEEKRKRENEEKKRMVLAKSKAKNEQLKVAWSLINEKNKEDKQKERPKRKQPKSGDQQSKKSMNSKTKLEECSKLEPEPEDYYNVGKETNSRLAKLQSKEEEHSETSSLKRYMVE